MKAITYLISLLLGFGGGMVATYIVEKGNTPHDSAFPHEVVGPGKMQVERPRFESPRGIRGMGHVDLRAAAGQTVPTVVNVTPVQIGRVYYASPWDFWFGVGHGQVREEELDMGIGSGVIISEDGYIVTNNHVIAKSDKIIVTLNDKRKFEATLVGTDPNTDIALLKIDSDGLQAIEYGNSDEVMLGEWVLAVGNPYNLTSTVTAGIISAKARALGNQMNLESFLQTDAAVNPGNSGGALVNAKGELIGINTAIQSPTGSYSGYSFAVPVNVVKKVVSDLKQFGRVQRVMLGIRMQELTPEWAKQLRLRETTGIYVAEVIRGGAAAKAGLQTGDVLLKINGYNVLTAPQLQEQLAKYAPGDIIRLTYSRGGQKHDVEMELQSEYGIKKS